jgi:hypothetical protein
MGPGCAAAFRYSRCRFVARGAAGCVMKRIRPGSLPVLACGMPNPVSPTRQRGVHLAQARSNRGHGAPGPRSRFGQVRPVGGMRPGGYKPEAQARDTLPWPNRIISQPCAGPSLALRACKTVARIRPAGYKPEAQARGALQRSESTGSEPCARPSLARRANTPSGVAMSWHASVPARSQYYGLLNLAASRRSQQQEFWPRPLE